MALAPAMCATVYLLGRRLLGEASGLIAGLLAGACGPAIFYTDIFPCTTLEVFLAVAALLAVTAALARSTTCRWFAAGIVGRPGGPHGTGASPAGPGRSPGHFDLDIHAVVMYESAGALGSMRGPGGQAPGRGC